MASSDLQPLISAIEAGHQIPHTDASALSAAEQMELRERLFSTEVGRRWLRADPRVDTAQADRLLAVEADFRQGRRDRTLTAIIKRASPAAVDRHLSAIAAGSGAPELWRRLAADPDRLVALATSLVGSEDRQAAEATLHLLVLDPLDPYEIGERRRHEIAEGALVSADAEVRGLAAEYLAEHDPAALRRALDRLLADESERVRGVAWDAALRADRSGTVEQAVALLSDEAAPVVVRRSALVALGTTLPTSQMADLLSYFVVHPDHDLAADAANLLFRQHRNPITAEAARNSPHPDVREVAERLLDPLRGSPAAGGSRPGDPTRSSTDIYADMIRQLEAKAGDQNGADER